MNLTNNKPKNIISASNLNEHSLSHIESSNSLKLNEIEGKVEGIKSDRSI